MDKKESKPEIQRGQDSVCQTKNTQYNKLRINQFPKLIIRLAKAKKAAKNQLKDYKEAEQKLYMATLDREKSEENYNAIIEGDNHNELYTKYAEAIKKIENLMELANEEIKEKCKLISEKAQLILDDDEARKEFTNKELQELALMRLRPVQRSDNHEIDGD